MTGTSRLSFVVHGNPVPKGSTKAWVFRGKDGRHHAATTQDAGDRLKTWDGRISTVAVDAMQRAGLDIPAFPKGVAVRVELTFRMPRPKSVNPRRRPLPVTKPDLDKLVRGVLDPLTHLIFDDDSQVVEVRACKVYHAEAGVVVIVEGVYG